MSTQPSHHYDWSDLAFASKKPLNDLKATFIAAPREMSADRLKQLFKQYLPKGNIILGLSKEDYVLGLEDQPAFRMLEIAAVEPTVQKINASNLKSSVTLLSYHQRDLPFILEKLDIARAVFISGSWYHGFHFRPEYYTLSKRRIPYELLSPFIDEAEARAYAESLPKPSTDPVGELHTEAEMLQAAADIAKFSLASSEYQTGVALGRRAGNRYELLATAFNAIVPYQTYAMHHGASRERHFSPMNDLNHYDANHAEIELIAKVVREGIDLEGTTIFINLLPCPACARMFTSTGIAELVYTEDHSSGYAIKMLEAAGKTVRRLIP